VEKQLNKPVPPQFARKIERVVRQTAADDIHTHLYDPAFGELLLWGIDDLLVYHYLIAESFRYFEFPYEKFWTLSKQKQADLIWDALFIQHSPISEACRGVLTTLNLLGLDVKKRDLPALRKWFKNSKVEDYTTRCMELAKVRSICMTNSPFDDVERPVWEKGFTRDERFKAALRIDPLLISWETTVPKLRDWGYSVETKTTAKTISEVRRFLSTWTKRMQAEYVMVSLGPEFEFPAKDNCAQLIEKAIIPHCAEFGIPFALMPGVKRQVNPQLRLAGDGTGQSDLQAIVNLCAMFPQNKFLCTILSRENQHELCVLARKFRNLHIFGCWWFMNIPYIVEEMTRMRLELIGLSVTPQHSDARVLDQIVYKWNHSREIISKVLVEKYSDLWRTGWEPSTAEIERDVQLLLGGAYQEFQGKCFQ
jgi:hypothetical protein